MGTTREDIGHWFDRGIEEKAEFMFVAVDTFDWEDYPVYLSDTDDFHAQLRQYQDPSRMSKVMEVYDLKRDKDEQLKAHRVWNGPESRPAATVSEGSK